MDIFGSCRNFGSGVGHGAENEPGVQPTRGEHSDGGRDGPQFCLFGLGGKTLAIKFGVPDLDGNWGGRLNSSRGNVL